MSKIYFCAVALPTNESNIGFASMLLNLPFRIKCDLNLDFNTDANKGYENFMNNGAYDTFVCMPTNMDGMAFLESVTSDKDADKSVFIGRHFLPVLDWEGYVSRGTNLAQYNVPVPLSTEQTLQMIELKGTTIPSVFVVKKTESYTPPPTLKEVFAEGTKAYVDAKNSVNVFSKHVFRGCVGLRHVIR